MGAPNARAVERESKCGPTTAAPLGGPRPQSASMGPALRVSAVRGPDPRPLAREDGARGRLQWGRGRSGERRRGFARRGREAGGGNGRPQWGPRSGERRVEVERDYQAPVFRDGLQWGALG